jgi:hypothetical protein
LEKINTNPSNFTGLERAEAKRRSPESFIKFSCSIEKLSKNPRHIREGEDRKHTENGLEICRFNRTSRGQRNADKLLCSLIFLLAPQFIQSLDFPRTEEPGQFT